MQTVTRIETSFDRYNDAVCLSFFDRSRTSVHSGYCYAAGTAVTPIKAHGEVKTLEVRLEGLIPWSGRRLKPIQPVAKIRGEKTVAEIIVEDRQAAQPLPMRNQAAIALLRSWRSEEADAEEQKKTLEYLKKALDEDRPSNRKLFP